MIIRKIVAEEFKGGMSGAEIIRELGKYSRNTMDGVKCSANNLLIISQLGDLAELSFIYILHFFTTSFHLQNPTSLLTHRYQPSNTWLSAL